ncbi:hypothetical protein FHW69_002519 [Luteibacter sp. Sphag1AF]|uniref:reprolysin-like metallopeptidase n=1 Tax=Luteibacter sp. Sphag1AF TaxID=2587031 RepID=UPI00161F4EFF|nr:zinc-dependent metalloprotease family protein [Luteibacter sp. Sphag1AF]MBB3227887.1 hypothetical protein [Luteibacter sp. Sphag1AF]
MDTTLTVRKHRLPLIIGALLCATAAHAETSSDRLWTDAPATDRTQAPARRGASVPSTLPSQYRTVMLDVDALMRSIAPRTHTTARGATTAAASIDIPIPEGGFSRFELESSDVMPASLAQRFPHLRSLKGRDASGRSIRLDTTARGVQALVSDEKGSWLVQPLSDLTGARKTMARGATPDATYAAFRRKDAARTKGDFLKNDIMSRASTAKATPAMTGVHATARNGGAVLRTFRIAMSATSAYTKALGGSVEDGLAGVIRTVNRVNQIFENDLGIHLVLAENSDRLILTDPANDPFEAENNNPAHTANGAEGRDEAVALANTRFTDEKLTQKGFDIGHVLDAHRDSGVAGTLGNSCVDFTPGMSDPGLTKAAGMTGSPKPVGDAFHVDFVAHELGHQLGAPHTYSVCGSSGNYANISMERRFEPGSGSTIMAYAGLCGENDLQANSDPFFHIASIDAINAWMASAGGACASTRSKSTRTPFLQPAAPEPFIPAHTPFYLSEIASFADPLATLTYAWDQVDVGVPQRSPVLTDQGNGPLFRSRAPTRESRRTFPAMKVLLGDEPLGLGDALPTTSRVLHFRAVVRDNLDHRSTVASSDRYVHVHNTGEAFAIRAPRAGASLTAGRTYLLNWNVAKTDQAPISCRNVSVDLSVDGGRTFLASPLLKNVANNGKARIALPATLPASAHARLRVTCDSSTFFALSPGDFTIRK